MKEFYDIKLIIPGNRKPGRYLQKIAPDFRGDLKALAESAGFVGQK
jgi:hypothetical protein